MQHLGREVAAGSPSHSTRAPDPARVAVEREWWSLLRELLGLLLRHPWLLLATVLPNVITPAIAPIQAWLAKDVLNGITKGEQTFLIAELLGYAPYAIGVFAGLGVLRLWEKLTNRMLDDRLMIEMQREWFDRRSAGCAGDHVARSINDCNVARKVFDIFQKELWVVAVAMPSVIIWQISLSPEWLPALLLAAAPSLIFPLLFGGLIQSASLGVVGFVAGIGSAVATGDRQKLYLRQERFWRQRIRFELWKQGSEITADLAGWLGIVLVMVIAVTGLWSLVPERVSAGDVAAFLINLRLIGKPVSELVKVYNKAREAWPSVRRVLRPEQYPENHDA